MLFPTVLAVTGNTTTGVPDVLLGIRYHPSMMHNFTVTDGAIPGLPDVLPSYRPFLADSGYSMACSFQRGHATWQQAQ
jgi:hypothetical protein